MAINTNVRQTTKIEVKSFMKHSERKETSHLSSRRINFEKDKNNRTMKILDCIIKKETRTRFQ